MKQVKVEDSLMLRTILMVPTSSPATARDDVGTIRLLQHTSDD